VGPAASGAIFSDDSLCQTGYPDASTGTAIAAAGRDVTQTCGNLGEIMTKTYQNGMTHGYRCDALNRLTLFNRSAITVGESTTLAATSQQFDLDAGRGNGVAPS